MKRADFHTPPALAAGLLIVLIAILAAGSLRLIFNLYTNFVRSTTAASALQYGTLLTRRLAQEDFLTLPVPEDNHSAEFNRLAESLHKLDRRLEYVTVREDDLVLYHWQAPLVPDTELALEESVTVTPRILHLGPRIEHVLDFSRQLADVNGRGRDLRIGLHKDILEHEQNEMLTALTTMFRVAMITVAVAFGVCLLAVLALVWRETRWLNRRRADEHLAFAGAVAGALIHDFRNPMSAMRLDSQLLQKEVGKGGQARGDKIAGLAGRLEHTLNRLDELFKEFLALSSPERALPEVFDAGICALDCVDLMKLRFERAGVRLIMDIKHDKLPVRGYPVQFKRALLNILNNAINFAPSGSSVTMAVRRYGGRFEISVRDEGPGIPPADRKKVFDMFYSRRPGGTGIGLALARTAVGNCGGNISVSGGDGGHGCVFVIRLPLCD